MGAEGGITEVTLYDEVMGDVLFDDVQSGTCTWRVARGGTVEQNH
jgi:hypothetical protein